MRRLAPLPLLALLVTAAPATAAPADPAVLRVAGRAGTFARVTLPHGAAPSNGGQDSRARTSAPWGGIVLRGTRGDPRAPVFYDVELSEALLCPGRRCGTDFQPAGFLPHDHYVPAGEYDAILIGPPGAYVEATVALRTGGRGVRTLRATRRARYQGAAFDPDATGTAVRGLTALDTSRAGPLLAIVAAGFVMEPSGPTTTEFCLAIGGTGAFDRAGGTAPCRDATSARAGFVFVTRPSSSHDPAAPFSGCSWMVAWAQVDGEVRVGGGVDATARSAYAHVTGVAVLLLP